VKAERDLEIISNDLRNFDNQANQMINT